MFIIRFNLNNRKKPHLFRSIEAQKKQRERAKTPENRNQQQQRHFKAVQCRFFEAFRGAERSGKLFAVAQFEKDHQITIALRYCDRLFKRMIV